jgi:putative membrane protein
MSKIDWRSVRPVFVLTSLTLIILAASCAKKESTGEQASTPAPAATSAPTPTPALTDANIAAIVVVANTIDIKNAQMAESKSNNPAVKAFAAQMISDHTSVNKKATELVTKLNVTPEDNDTSRGLVTSNDATREAIKAKDGAEFDKAYIDNEVAYHQAVIDVLDKTLIPGASNAELKDLLVSVKPAFEAHLDHAKHVQAALAK